MLQISSNPIVPSTLEFTLYCTPDLCGLKLVAFNIFIPARPCRHSRQASAPRGLPHLPLCAGSLPPLGLTLPAAHIEAEGMTIECFYLDAMVLTSNTSLQFGWSGKGV